MVEGQPGNAPSPTMAVRAAVRAAAVATAVAATQLLRHLDELPLRGGLEDRLAYACQRWRHRVVHR